MHILLADDQPIVRAGLMSVLQELAEQVVFHEAGDERAVFAMAQEQLGHASVTMTEHYVRKRRGRKVTPTK